MLFFPVFANPKFCPPSSLSAVSLSQFSASLFISKDCALFSPMALAQPFSFQSFLHSFRCDGGVRVCVATLADPKSPRSKDRGYNKFAVAALFRGREYLGCHTDSCTPPRSIFMPPDRDSSVKSFGIKSFTDPHPLTLIESNRYKNSGGGGC
jgi:hypothetical protein